MRCLPPFHNTLALLYKLSRGYLNYVMKSVSYEVGYHNINFYSRSSLSKISLLCWVRKEKYAPAYMQDI